MTSKTPVPVELKDIHARVISYLEALAEGLAPGRFRFCLRGSLVPTQGISAQVSTCFAMKVAWQAGIWNNWPELRRKSAIAFIKSFQREDGYFNDPWLQEMSRPSVKSLVWQILMSLMRRQPWAELRVRKERNLRAETRQSAATLFMVGERPQYALPLEVTTVKDVKSYLEGLDWRYPWSAGSHLSHLIFFLATNYRAFNQPPNYGELIDVILDFLSSIRDPETGCWFRGDPPDIMKINGAMKVFSGLQWLERPYPDCTRLLDFALRQPFQQDGCDFLNRLFVVHEAMKGVPEGFRQDQIREIASHALTAVCRFKKSDGGFSFYESRAQTTYYGARVSRGLSVSDLHGTAMITWALALVLNLLFNETSNFNLWRIPKV